MIILLHYLPNYHGSYSYTHSRHATFVHDKIPNFNGIDLWLTPCSPSILNAITLATPVQLCHTKLNGDSYSACSNHCDQKQIDISYLKLFGHKWIKVMPLYVEALSIGTVHKANFVLNKLLSTITLIDGCSRLFAGAAGGDMNANATVGDMAIQFQRFIPNLICLDIRHVPSIPGNIKYVRKDIADFTSNLKFDLIISDLWTRELFFQHIYAVCFKYLILSGTLVFKLTNLVYNVNRAQILNLLAHFTDVQVLRPPSAHGTEIFVFCFNFSASHNLRPSVEANIYYHFRNVNQIVQRVNLFNARGFKTATSLIRMNTFTCSSCDG